MSLPSSPVTSRRPRPWRGGAAPGAAVGALAGLVGGLFFGLAMVDLGMLSTVASIVRVDSPYVGFAVHMTIAAVLGAIFGTLVWRQDTGAGETVLWGLTYGAFWWFLGALTLLPILLGEPVSWELDRARDEFPSLVGHLVYGLTAAVALALFRGMRDRRAGRHERPTRASVGRGALAGAAAAALLGPWLPSGTELLASADLGTESGALGWLITLGFGGLTGLGYASLYPRPRHGGGPALIRGAAYGFLLWVLGPLTLFPGLEGGGLAWSAVEARELFETLPGYVLFGAALVLVYRWQSGLVGVLFDDLPGSRDEGPGARVLRALGHGVIAGLVGGLLFTLVMLQLGFLPTVAAIVGSDSAVSGLVVHLLIANAIGASYGLLFRRQSFDPCSALGWGLAYGFVWWVLGALTLLPVLLGGSPSWSAPQAAEAFPSLIGHLAYGAGVGLTFHTLQARSNPWWLSADEAAEARSNGMREQALSAAPALWTLVVLIALCVPLLLAPT